MPLAFMAVGALMVGVASPAVALDDGTTVQPGDLDPSGEDSQTGGWDLVAGQACNATLPTDGCLLGYATGVRNKSGWSRDADTGYAVLDPTFTSHNGFGVASLQTGNYNPDVVDSPILLSDIDVWSVSLRTVGGGTGPVLQLRVEPDPALATPLPSTCLISFEVGSVPSFDSLVTPLTTPGWTDFSDDINPGGCGRALQGGGKSWVEVKDAMGTNAYIRGGPGAPGVSVSTGETAPQVTGYAVVHVDSFSFMGDSYDFDAPIMRMAVDETPGPIVAGESVPVPVTATLSGPNQATIENDVDFLTGFDGLTSSGVPTVLSSEPEGLCEISIGPAPALEFVPKRGLATRPFDRLGLVLDPLRPQTRNTLLATLDPTAEPEAEVGTTVTVTTSEDNFGTVSVSEGGTCVIGLAPPADPGTPANAVFDPENTFTVEVTPADDLREAPALPEEVPAGTGALTVEPECLVGGDTMTVTAPAGSFAPNSAVNVGLYDSGFDVGEFPAGDDGSLSFEAPLPVGVPDGPQTVLAVGYASGENDVDLTYLSAEVEVGCADGAGGSGGIPSGIPAGGGTDGGNGLLGTGLAMLLVVGSYLGLRMRRMLSV